MTTTETAWNVVRALLFTTPEAAAWLVVLVIAGLRVRGLSLGFVVAAAVMWLGATLPWLGFPLVMSLMVRGVIPSEIFQYISLGLSALTALLDTLTWVFLGMALVSRRAPSTPED